MSSFFRRTWLEINLDALSDNYHKIRESVNPAAKIMAVVKADAYGHGVEHVVKELSQAGADCFGVSNLEEAMQIRYAGIHSPVLILGYTPPEYALKIALNGFSQAVFGSAYAKELSRHAKKAGVQINIHIKADTGMSRLGFMYQDSVANAKSVDEIAEVCRLPALYPEGIFTHFASADEDGEGEIYTRFQFELFTDIISRLKARGICFELRHCCNSAGAVRFPEMHMDMVRPGIILYGLSPSRQTTFAAGLTPVMELKTIISMVKELDAGACVSYGRAFTSKRPMRIAAVPVGYADGYPRLLSNKSSMLVQGKKAPVIGRVCMDQTIIDVTDISDVKEGMTATVFGSDNGSTMSVDSLAEKIELINYEFVCGMNKRVPRIYLKNGSIECVTDYMER